MGLVPSIQIVESSLMALLHLLEADSVEPFAPPVAGQGSAQNDGRDAR